MKSSVRILAIVLTLIGPLAKQVDAATLITSLSGLTTFGSTPESLGFRFTANVNSSVVSLGYYDVGADGLLSSHTVGLWDASGTLLGQVVVSSGSTFIDGFFYESLTEGIDLSAGSDYYIAATTLGDSWVYQAASFATSPEFSYVDSYFAPGSPSGLSFPSNIASDRQYMNVNLQTTNASSPIPEVETILPLGALLLGGSLMRRRRR